MSKTRFSDTEDNDARDIAKAEVQRADIVARELTRVKARINDFFNAVDYVVFDSEETAPRWALNWYDFLIDGTVPTEPEVVLEVVEETPDDGTA